MSPWVGAASAEGNSAVEIILILERCLFYQVNVGAVQVQLFGGSCDG
jgi:hypothetical protein